MVSRLAPVLVNGVPVNEQILQSVLNDQTLRHPRKPLYAMNKTVIRKDFATSFAFKDHVQYSCKGNTYCTH